MKPSVCCLLLYYIRLYHIEERRLGKTDFAQCVYLSKELKQLEKNNNSNTNSNPSSNFDMTLDNVSNMLQEIKNSSNNTKEDSDDNKEYDRLKLLLKMS